MLLQWHVKDPGLSAKSAGGRLHLNMHTPFTQWSWSGLTMLSRHSMGTYHWRKWAHKQFVRGTLGHSRLRLLSHCGLTLACKVELLSMSWSPLWKKKSAGRNLRKWIIEPSLKILASEEKATTTTTDIKSYLWYQCCSSWQFSHVLWCRFHWPPVLYPSSSPCSPAYGSQTCSHLKEASITPAPVSTTSSEHEIHVTV